MSLSDLRREYALAGLKESDLDPSPFKQFDKWFQQALAAGLPEPNAMTLATATLDGKPSARVVLLKGFDERGFVFFTNYESQKGLELSANPHAALVFYWIELERQVRISGRVSRVSSEESETYFHSRPTGSQLSAWASQQSEVVSERKILEDRLEELTHEYQSKPIPLPPFWGGYRVAPETLEFWQGRPNRLHDRLRYTLQPGSQWLIERLSP
jgi:pyridoxamine 5'-phosphate oxidase